MEFRTITPADFATYKPYFDRQRYRLCDYALASIIAWQNDAYRPQVATQDGFLVVAAEFAVDTHLRHMILPIGPDGEMPPERLADLVAAAGHDSVWFVPRCYLDTYGEDAVAAFFKIQRDPDLDDYIYRRADLAELAGGKYAKKRNLVRQFHRSHVAENRVTVGPIGPDDVADCIDYLEIWCGERACGVELAEDLACERDAATNTLENLERLDVRGLHLRIDGAVKAFGVAAHLTPDLATLQYEKADARIKGLYQYFDQQCARRLFNGYRYINKESDMGLAGLAKSKRSYHPVEIVEAYRLLLSPQ
ncbi:MAG: phosphatidylglycerol lysyltransferase domain-containing protein [Desulfosarcinaceae bacterium]|nr:phosphatidylglycerol lysyltransferase domain-containing protein [Desulfosarcinaceae bacterium]